MRELIATQDLRLAVGIGAPISSRCNVEFEPDDD
jgi:hypothetical protein